MHRSLLIVAAFTAATVSGCGSPRPSSPAPTSVATPSAPPTLGPSTPGDSPASTAAATDIGRYIWLDDAEMDGKYHAALPLFAFDEGVALDINVESTTTEAVVTRMITYASSTGQTVPAALVAPADATGLPGIVWLCPCGPVVDRAQEFAGLGAIVITINPPQARRDAFFSYTDQDRADVVELIIELRRAIDVLIETGADPNRIAFVGYSWGAAMGATLSGVEHRIGTYALMFADGGVVEHTLEGPDGPTAVPLQGPALERWLVAMEPVEGIYFVRHAAPSSLFFQNGFRDESVARVSAERVHDYASEPKAVTWYDSGHDPTPDAPEVWCDLAKWLKAELELSSSAIAEC